MFLYIWITLCMKSNFNSLCQLGEHHSYNTSLDKPLFGTYNCKEFEKILQVLNNKIFLGN